MPQGEILAAFLFDEQTAPFANRLPRAIFG